MNLLERENVFPRPVIEENRKTIQIMLSGEHLDAEVALLRQQIKQAVNLRETQMGAETDQNENGRVERKQESLDRKSSECDKQVKIRLETPTTFARHKICFIYKTSVLHFQYS